jgi:signal transduction histidine kinase
MASELHLETVQEDYEELQRKHAALQASEARYRELAAQLEQRVAEQVKTIEAAQRQLYQSEKLASVGQLAAGVAHEINNPIGFIVSNLSTAQGYVQRLNTFAVRLHAAMATAELQQAWREDDLDFVLRDFVALLAESSEGAARVARIVTDLKGFSRVDQVGAEEADINDVIRQVCNVAAGQVRGRAKVTLQLGTLPRLRCNSAQLGQVFLNLLLNAADAVAAPGEIRFESDMAENSIRVRVSDNGRGIAAELLPRIFDPFFTTKTVGSGTGLGLTVSNDIVKAHGGSIEVASTVGKGSTFTVWLPVK